MLAELNEGLCNAGSISTGGCAWTTGKVRNRIGLALVAGCRQDDDVDAYHPAGFNGAVFVDFKGAALCGALHVLDLAVVQDELPSLFDSACRLQRQNKSECYEGK